MLLRIGWQHHCSGKMRRPETGKLALGTVQFGLPYGIANQLGIVPPEEVSEILDQARQSGVDTIDTAIAYGDSEQVLGMAGVAGFKVISKLPAVPDDVRDAGTWALAQVEGSLGRLGIRNLHGLFLHKPDDLLGRHGRQLTAAMASMKSSGLVSKLGISVYGPDEIAPAMENLDVDIVQAPFNLVDRRLSNSGWLSKLHTMGVEVHVRSVFLQGLLLMQVGRVREQFPKWNHLWNTWEKWQQDSSMSPLQLCIGFVSLFSEIHRMVIGIDSVLQFREVLATATGALPETFPDLTSNDVELVNPSHWCLA